MAGKLNKELVVISCLKFQVSQSFRWVHSQWHFTPLSAVPVNKRETYKELNKFACSNFLYSHQLQKCPCLHSQHFSNQLLSQSTRSWVLPWAPASRRIGTREFRLLGFCRLTLKPTTTTTTTTTNKQESDNTSCLTASFLNFLEYFSALNIYKINVARVNLVIKAMTANINLAGLPHMFGNC